MSVTTPGGAQKSGAVHSGPPLQVHTPSMQVSRALQHRPLVPHAGPLGQPPLGAHADNATASSQPAHASGHTSVVHAIEPSLQVHELQPSPAANVSPE